MWEHDHKRYTDAEALAAAVQAGAITDGVTKAPTHDAVYDLKTTVDALVTATREFFVPATFGSEMAPVGGRPGAYCDAVDEYGLIAFYIPHDFNDIVEAVILVHPYATQAAANWDISSVFATNGEAYNTHAQSDTTTTYNVTNGQLYEVDISGILTGIAAGDNVGIMLRQKTAGHNVAVIGVRFKYS